MKMGIDISVGNPKSKTQKRMRKGTYRKVI